MKNSRSITCLIIFFLFGFSSADENSIWFPPEQEILLEILDHAYNLEFDQFEYKLTSYKVKYPGRPEGIFAPVVAWWIKVSTDIWNTQYDEQFIQSVDSIMTELEKIKKDDPLFPVAEFYLYSATGFKGIINVTREDWFSAALNGRVAFKGVERALQGEIPNPDAKFGTGLYLYYADILPQRYPILRPLFFFYPDGDKQQGLQQLKDTISNGLFAKVVSAHMYSIILYTRENRLLEAYSIMKELSLGYPKNPTFLSWLTGMSMRLHKLDEAEKLLDTYRERIENNEPFYPANKLPQIYLRYGNIYFERENYNKALQYFNEVLKPVDKTMEKRVSRFKVYALLDAGRTHLKLNQTDQAREKFKLVLAMDEHRNSHEQAQKELDSIKD